MTRRNIIKIDEEKCNGCGQCIIACAEGALEIVNGKAKVVKESYCDGLGACIGECPEGALTIEEREVEEFDEEAVKEHLNEIEHIEKRKSVTHKGQEGHEEHERLCCPSAQPRVLEPSAKRIIASDEEIPKSQLGHWPIQLMLVPENAPFLKGRDLIVLADCAAVAYVNLHEKFLNGNAVVMGCPKFDNVEIYGQKLTGIIRSSGIESISVVHMEVPCCFGLKKLVSDAIHSSGRNISLQNHVIGIHGEVLEH